MSHPGRILRTKAASPARRFCFAALRSLGACCLLAAALAGCGSPAPVAPAAPSPSPTVAPTSTRTPTPSPTATPLPPSPTPLPTATLVPPTQTPPPIPLPAAVVKGISFTPYLPNTCRYLTERWDPERSQPGTVVVPVMFHSVTKSGRQIAPDDHTTVTHDTFAAFMEHAHALGFQTITSEQLVNFLYHNVKIPTLSMILIIDDRRPGTVREHFMPYLKKYGWTVTMAYITGVPSAYEWLELKQLFDTGRVDIQSHGFLHNGQTYFSGTTPETTILREIYGPIPVIREHFGYDPVAFIWPGGDFTPHTVQVALQANYRIGFTVFARGPLLFNAIPQGPEEMAIGQPLMLLPRYWSPSAYYTVDDARRLSLNASTAALQNKAAELSWVEKNCK